MKKKKLVKMVNTNHSFTFNQELALVGIEALGTVVGGCLALAAALIERQTMKEAKEDENG